MSIDPDDLAKSVARLEGVDAFLTGDPVLAGDMGPEADVAAIQAYTRVIASLLRSAVRAHLKGEAASQLQHALDHRSLIEQAKGVIMQRRGVDQQAAFELLRSQARSTRRRLHDVALETVRSIHPG